MIQKRYIKVRVSLCNKLKMSQRFVRQSLKELQDSPLLCTGESTPEIQWAILCIKFLDETGAEEGNKSDKKTGDQLKESGMFSSGKRRLREDMISVFRCIEDCYKKDGQKVLSIAIETRTSILDTCCNYIDFT